MSVALGNTDRTVYCALEFRSGIELERVLQLESADLTPVGNQNSSVSFQVILGNSPASRLERGFRVYSKVKQVFRQ